ncbi:hypothetical protein RN001_011418 [Aquatica leii]|uniref:non-specific serine/threonine protein kinase n=1 Tax=Aquatica leii TaxID=1421715 RepID=A0AAN7S7F2_9COLE|nr:hypothetical protein RN001_011418 [Aquatica leii]
MSSSQESVDLSQCQDFAGRWICLQTLGEGAYGEVKLLMHRVSKEMLAAKIIDLKKHKDTAQNVHKEVKIHGILDHTNIIKLYGNRHVPEMKLEIIYLEFAAGGELFNKIEPDYGMAHAEAQRYFKQLMLGVNYLHQRGVAHRDIKPENLLLDADGNLKISDFGLATIFRLKGKERLLDKRCGTLPYVAPEILIKPYRAQPADIWSCGIVLVAMAAGELPWDEPTSNCMEFNQWLMDHYLLITPWSKIENTLLSLMKKILTPDPHNRPTIEQIFNHPWMLKKLSKDQCTNSKQQDSPVLALSQPADTKSSRVDPQNILELFKTNGHNYFSQPTQNDDLLINSQIPFTQTHQKNEFPHLIKRMTRFFVKTSCEETIERLGAVLDSLLYTWSMDKAGLTISTVDNRKAKLVFKANVIEMQGKLLLNFRLSRGCGLEFKRRFLKLKKCLNDIILHSAVNF